jgi:phosphatidylglycerophosphatase C
VTDTPPRSDARPLAAFDFDGTLTHKDSFTAFLFETCGFFRVSTTCLTSPGLWLHYLMTRDRGALKARLLYKLLGPITRAKLDGRVARFISRRGIALFRPDARAEWDKCKAMHERVIVTASPEILVRPLGEMIGADRVIGTRLKFSADGRLTPELDGINCRGAEKVRRLREAYGDGLDLDLAFGDTAGDREMLNAARFGHYRAFNGKP